VRKALAIACYEDRTMSDAEREQDAQAPPRKPLTPAAQRALAEAAERRAQAEAASQDRPKELQGPKGPEPTRFGDWERKGIASDF
jgi:hypothetical protein